MNMKKISAKFICLLLMVALCLPMMSIPVKADDNTGIEEVKSDQFDVKVSYGLDGVIINRAALPIVANIKNGGKDFNGELRVVLYQEYQKDLCYAKDISLPAGGEKSISMTVPGMGSLSVFYVQIVDKNGKIKYCKKYSTSMNAADSNIVIGMLSDDYTGLNYFDGLHIVDEYAVSTWTETMDSTTKIIELKMDEFPARADGLAICSMIIIDEFDTSKLTDEQYDVLKQWVFNGGTLVIATGSDYQKTLSRFNDDFVSGEIGTLRKKSVNLSKEVIDAEYMAALQQTYSEPENSNDEDVPDVLKQTADQVGTNDYLNNLIGTDGLSLCGDITVDSLDISVNGANSVRLMTDDIFFMKNYGNGNIVVSSIDLAMEPVTSWEGNQSLARAIVINTLSETNKGYASSSYYDHDSDLYIYQSAIDLVDGTKHPNAALYGVIFLIYILAMGPVIYLILKARKKQSKFFVAIPILALSFTLIMFLSSFMYKVNKVLVDEVHIITVGENSASEKIGIKIQNPRAKKATITLAPECVNTTLMDDDYYYGFNDTNKGYDIITKETAEGTDLEVLKDRAFSSHYYSMTRAVDTAGNFGLELTGYKKGIAGNVINNTPYDMKDVVVLYGDYYAYVGDLKQGESRNISVGDNVYAGNYISAWSILQYQNKKAGSITDLLGISGRETNRNRHLLDAAIDSRAAHGVEDGVVIGVVEKYDHSVVSNEKKVKDYQAGAIMQYFNEPFSDVASSYIPNITECATDTTYNMHVGDDGTGYLWNESFEQTYLLPKTITTLSIVKKEESAIDNGILDQFEVEEESPQCDIYILDPYTAQYVPIFVDKEVEDISKYVEGGDGYILLKFESTSTSESREVPMISAEGDD